MQIASRNEPDCSGTNHGAPGNSPPGSLDTGKTMHTHLSKAGHRPQRARRFVFAFVPALLLVLAALSGCSAPRSTTVSAAERESTFRQVAADYASGGDISAIRARLDELGLANPAQFVVALAEADLSAG